MADAQVAAEALDAPAPPAQRIARDLSVPVPSAEGRAETDLVEARKARLERNNAVAPYEQDMAKDYQENRKKLESMSIDKVDLKPWAEKPPEQSPIEAFGSLASVFAGLASMFTHTPATSSMNAMASAINARRKNDLEGYELAHQAWKDNTQLMVDRHKIESEDMQRALDLMDKKPQQAAAMIKQIAAKYGDNISETLTEAGMYERIAQLHQSRQSAIDQIKVQEKRLVQEDEHFRMTNKINEEKSAREERKQDQAYAHSQWAETFQEKHADARDEHQARMDEINTRRYATEEERRADALAETIRHNRVRESLDREKIEAQFDKPAMVTVEDPSTGRTNVLAQQSKLTGQWVTADERREPISGVTNVSKPGEAADADNVKKTADMVANYRLAPLSGFVMKTPFGQAVMAEVGRINPNYSAPQYAAINDTVKKFSSGQQGNSVRAVNVAIMHMNTLENLVSALGNGDIKQINRFAQDFAEQTGQPAPTSFDAAKSILAQEVIKAVVANGGGVTERQDAAARVSRAQSTAALKGIIGTWKELLAGQVRGLRHQYEGTTGLKDFDDRFLMENTKKALGETRAMGGGLPEKLRGKTGLMKNKAGTRYRDSAGKIYDLEGNEVK